MDRAAARSLALLVAIVADGTLLRLHLAGRPRDTGGAELEAFRERLDPNTASALELRLLRGIGPERARAIVERRRSRPFLGVGDLMAVPGIGPRTLAGIRDDLRFRGPNGPSVGGERIESDGSLDPCPPDPTPAPRGPP